MRRFGVALFFSALLLPVAALAQEEGENAQELEELAAEEQTTDQSETIVADVEPAVDAGITDTLPGEIPGLSSTDGPCPEPPEGSSSLRYEATHEAFDNVGAMGGSEGYDTVGQVVYENWDPVRCTYVAVQTIDSTFGFSRSWAPDGNGGWYQTSSMDSSTVTETIVTSDGTIVRGHENSYETFYTEEGYRAGTTSFFTVTAGDKWLYTDITHEVYAPDGVNLCSRRTDRETPVEVPAGADPETKIDSYYLESNNFPGCPAPVDPNSPA